jgi:hypothetical protein
VGFGVVSDAILDIGELCSKETPSRLERLNEEKRLAQQPSNLAKWKARKTVCEVAED